nr:RagB/SusD family nutrient uptake outer membrane protein [Chryseolinea sp.]
MNKIKKTILMRAALFVSVLGVLGACKDSFLEINPQARLSASSLGTKAGVEATLIGAYAILDGYHIDGNNIWPSDPVNWIMGSITTDDAY